MHAIKGGWVGQTFALAKSHESDGRKSRIRRSKEERKAMVESFIQKYQKLNNGSFPSLNLTHKEVGGSFYTVREIVRDIIQENRVLGPAKFIEENQSTYQLEQNPLGSIALEPLYPLPILSNGSQSAEHEYQSSGEEMILTSESHDASSPEHQIFDDGNVVNGFLLGTEEKRVEESNYVEIQGNNEVIKVERNGYGDSDKEDEIVSKGNYESTESEMVENRISMVTIESHEVENKECQEIHQTELRVSKESEGENITVEELAVSMSKAIPIGDVKVETFPVRTVAVGNGLDGSSNGVVEKANSFGENTVQKVVELASGVEDPQTDTVNSRPVDEIEVTKLPNLSSDKDLGLTNEEEEVAAIKASSDCLLNATTAFDRNEAVAEAKTVNDPNGMTAKRADRSGDSNGQLKTENSVDVQHKGTPQKEINPTLDRINLESWDGGAKNPGRPQVNPLWAVFKAFLNAVVKFWSE